MHLLFTFHNINAPSFLVNCVLFPWYLLCILICFGMCFDMPHSDLFQLPLFFHEQCSLSCTFCFQFSFITMTFLIFCFTAWLRTCHFSSSAFLFMANEIINQSKNPAIGTYKPCMQNLATSDVTWKSEDLGQHGGALKFVSLEKVISRPILSHWSGGGCSIFFFFPLKIWSSLSLSEH